MELTLTDAALSDLQSIRAYTLETWGEEQEEKYLDEMWNRFEEILAHPQRWRSRNDLFPGCQLAPQGKHIILFSIEGDTLQLVRVFHSAMDFPRQVAEDL